MYPCRTGAFRRNEPRVWWCYLFDNGVYFFWCCKNCAWTLYLYGLQSINGIRAYLLEGLSEYIFFSHFFGNNDVLNDAQKNSEWSNVSRLNLSLNVIVSKILNVLASSVGGEEVRLKDMSSAYLLLWFPIILANFSAMLPFFSENKNCDSLIFLSDSIFISSNTVVIFWGMQGFYLVTNSVSWQVPIFFTLFLPLIEAMGRVIRTLNLTLRLSSNLLSGHLLMTLLSCVSQLISFYKKRIFMWLSLKLMSINSYWVYFLEFFVGGLQYYVYGSLTFFFGNQES